MIALEGKVLQQNVSTSYWGILLDGVYFTSKVIHLGEGWKFAVGIQSVKSWLEQQSLWNHVRDLVDMEDLKQN